MMLNNETEYYMQQWNYIKTRQAKKCTDAHIFEMTMKIELSPIPQAYTLNL